MTLKRRLARLEAALPPNAPAVDHEALRMKMRIMAELSGQGPEESPAEAIARLPGYRAPWKMAEAMRHKREEFQEHRANAARRASWRPPEMTPAATSVLHGEGFGGFPTRKHKPKSLFSVVPATGLEPVTL